MSISQITNAVPAATPYKVDVQQTTAAVIQRGSSAVTGPAGKNSHDDADAVQVDREAMARNLEEVIQKLNEQMKANQRGLSFSKDQVNGATVVKVINSHTGEMVRQIPDVSLLRAAHSIEALKGLIHDEST